MTPGHVLAWAYGIGGSGREPSSATIGARIACLSSYFRFLIRMDLATGNPCDALQRPKSVQSVARGLSADEFRRLLAVVPDTVAGRRDRALLLTFVLTGRRRSEVIGLTAGDISVLDAEEALARQPVDRRRLSPPEIVDYLRSLPKLWADSGPDGRQAMVVSTFARLDVLGFQQLEYELTPNAIDLGLDIALPARMELGYQIAELVGARGVSTTISMHRA